MKKRTFALISMLLVVFLAACGGNSNSSGNEGGGSGSGNYTIGVTYTTRETGATHIGLEKFKELVEEQTDGDVQMKIYTNGELYASEREAIEATQRGNIEKTGDA